MCRDTVTNYESLKLSSHNFKLLKMIPFLCQIQKFSGRTLKHNGFCVFTCTGLVFFSSKNTKDNNSFRSDINSVKFFKRLVTHACT